MSSGHIFRGMVVTAIWLAAGVVYAVYTIYTAQIPHRIFEPAVLGTFLGGWLSPLALGWFALLYYEQARALRDAVEEQKRALLVQVQIGLRNDFASNVYLKHGKVIKHFIKSCGSEDYWVVFQRKFHSGKKEDNDEVELVDEARRAFSEYCHSVLLVDDEEIIMKVLKKGLVEFLHNEIWNLEIARDPNFERRRFDELWPLYDMKRPTGPDFPAVDNRPVA